MDATQRHPGRFAGLCVSIYGHEDRGAGLVPRSLSSPVRRFAFEFSERRRPPSGLLIHAAVGSSGGAGGLRTNRSGLRGVGGVEHVRRGRRAARGAWPWWTAAGVISPIPECRCAWLYQSAELPAVSAGVLDVSRTARGTRAGTSAS